MVKLKCAKLSDRYVTGTVVKFVENIHFKKTFLPTEHPSYDPTDRGMISNYF